MHLLTTPINKTLQHHHNSFSHLQNHLTLPITHQNNKSLAETANTTLKIDCNNIIFYGTETK